MKKSLYMTTALAAAGVLALGATDAVAAEKAKKMSIANGGFFKSMIAFAQNDGSFESTTSGTSRTHYDAFNIVNDSEIYFKGNTKLDSGVRVDVIVQFETDAVKGGATIDESYVKLTGGFGDIKKLNAKQTKDFKLCEEIENTLNQNACRLKVAKERNDQSLCKEIKIADLVQICNEYFDSA